MRRLVWCLTLLLLLLPCAVWAVIETSWKEGPVETWITNNTNVTSGSRVVSGNITLTSTGFIFGKCELNTPSWGGTVAANSGMTVWACPQVDGTNFADCSTAADPTWLPMMTFPLAAVSTAQRITRYNVVLPPGVFRVVVKNDGTGVTLQGATSAWTLKCTPYTPQGTIK